jgi:hypothetical protein
MHDAYLLRLLAEWEAAYAAAAGLSASGVDVGDPRMDAATAAEDRALAALLQADAVSHRGLLIKLMLALRFDDGVDRALDPGSRTVAPRALLSLWRDLDRLAWHEAIGVR